jgi:rhodanese-related sulfurtransferase
MRVSRQSVCAALVTLGLIVSLACVRQPVRSAAEVPNLFPRQAQELIEKNHGNPGFVVLDVRTPAEFASGHLPGAVNVDFRSPDFQAQAGTLAKGKSYLVYCRTGHRSGLALPILQRLGFTSLYHLEGGITGWQREALPVEPAPAR